MPDAPDLKATLNLPYTGFPMKANLPQSEPRRLAAWQQEGLYEQIRAVRRRVHPALVDLANTGTVGDVLSQRAEFRASRASHCSGGSPRWAVRPSP